MFRFTLSCAQRNAPFWQIEDSWDGYQWIDPSDGNRNMISYIRRDEDGKEIVVIVNFAVYFFVCLFVCLFVFETGFPCVALAVQELVL